MKITEAIIEYLDDDLFEILDERSHDISTKEQMLLLCIMLKEEVCYGATY